MRKSLLVLTIGLAVAAFAVAGCGGDDDEGSTTTDTTTETETTGAGEAGGTLIGSVGPGFEISLTTEDGQNVTSLAAGSYTIEVDDKAPDHNFHLSGPGVDSATEVGEVETATWEVELEAGSYTFVCDPHASTMKGSFEVTG